MGNLSKFDIGVIVAFVVLLLAGVGGWWYTSGWVTEAEERIDEAHGKLMRLAKERYTPSKANIDKLEENAAKLDEAVNPIVTAKLAPAESPLLQIKPMNPVSWKTDKLLESVRRMREAAQSKGITLPEGFYFSFSRYRSQDPTEANTEVLGKQLYGIEQLVTILFATGGPPMVRSLEGVSRSFDEDGSYKPSGSSSIGGTAPAADAERLPRNVEEVNGLYRAYPFEVRYTGNTQGLRKYLDALATAQTVFVVRAVTVENSKSVSPTRTEVEAMVNRGTPGASAAGGYGAAAGYGSPAYGGRSGASRGTMAQAIGPQPVFGSEYLNIRVRVDMIEWIGNAPAATAEGATDAKGAAAKGAKS